MVIVLTQLIHHLKTCLIFKRNLIWESNNKLDKSSVAGRQELEAWQKTRKPSLGQWFSKSSLGWGAKTLVGDLQCQTIFIIMQRLYLPFSLCWHWHRCDKSNHGKTFSNLAEIKALGPNCLLVVVPFTSSYLRF